MIGEPIGSAGDRRREVITFYSYKGGTGRSMLLANVAWLLASTGCKVLLIDWDLEAPGLHRYFKPFLGEDTELRSQKGVMEWVTDYWDAYLDHPSASRYEPFFVTRKDTRLAQLFLFESGQTPLDLLPHLRNSEGFGEIVEGA